MPLYAYYHKKTKQEMCVFKTYAEICSPWFRLWLWFKGYQRMYTKNDLGVAKLIAEDKEKYYDYNMVAKYAGSVDDRTFEKETGFTKDEMRKVYKKEGAAGFN